MKRIGFIYEQIISIENCKAAILNASAKKRMRQSVQEITSNLNYYASDLSKRLIALDFLTPYKTRMISDGLSGKNGSCRFPHFIQTNALIMPLYRYFNPYS